MALFNSIKNRLDSFWSKYPALLYGLCALFSFHFAIDRSPESLGVLLIIGFTCGCSPARYKARLKLLGCVALAAALYGMTVYRFPDVGSEGRRGSIVFQVASLSVKETHFGKQWVYRGYGQRWIEAGRGTAGKYFPCTIEVPVRKGQTRPKADCAYWIAGLLKKAGGSHFIFQPEKDLAWLRIKNTSSWSEARYEWHQKVKAFIKSHLKDYRSAEFLSGIVTGEFEDRILRAEFGKLGLQHLMAISGFHFALLAGILTLFLRLFLPFSILWGVLMALMTGYFIFLGSCPSIVRAWAMSMAGMGGALLERRGSALNALGVAFLFVLLFDPLLIGAIGFQFSAIVTAAILIFHPIAQPLMANLIPARTLEAMRNMGRFDQHCYCILSCFREGLTLALAVNMIAVPLTCYYFQRFPAASLIYNLFIPFLVSIAAFLLVIAAAVYLIVPFLGYFLFIALNAYTHGMLTLIYDAPPFLNYQWYAGPVSSILLMGYLIALFGWGAYRNAQDPSICH